MNRIPGITLLVLAALVGPVAAQEVHGIDKADMDPSRSPCRDFFLHADGGWIKVHPIPPEYPRWTTFSVLAQKNELRLRGILEALAARKDLVPGSDERKLADYWSACMDEKAAEAAGAKPIEGELARIAAIHSTAALQAEVAHLQAEGVHVLFGFGSEQDRRDSEQVIAGIREGGLGLPDRDYYLKDDDRSRDIRAKYVAHVARMLSMLGESPARGRKGAEAVMAIETELAKVSMTRVERRDAEKTYHRLSPTELAKLAPDFD